MIAGQESVFKTKWFDLVSKQVAGDPNPYYALQTPDCVVVLAINSRNEIVLVSQFRPTIEKVVLELPSGHIEPSESSEVAARRELLEETGYTAANMFCLGKFYPDTGRLTNTIYCYFASDLKKVGNTGEPGIEIVEKPIESLRDLLTDGTLSHGQDVACAMLAVLKDKIVLS